MYAVFPRLRLRVNLFALPAFALMLWLEGGLPAALLLLAALLHELGHFAALRVYGIPIRRVDLEPMGARIVYDDALCPLRASAWIAFSGALVNLFVCTAVSVFLALGFSGAYQLPLLFFALANGFLALLNLLPWETLDGGKLLLALLLLRLPPERSGDAERICRTVSRAAAVLLFALLFALSAAASFPLWTLLLSAVLLVQAVK